MSKMPLFSYYRWWGFQRSGSSATSWRAKSQAHDPEPIQSLHSLPLKAKGEGSRKEKDQLSPKTFRYGSKRRWVKSDKLIGVYRIGERRRLFPTERDDEQRRSPSEELVSTDTHSHSYTRAHSPICACTHMHACLYILIHVCTLSHTCWCTCPDPCAHTYVHTHSSTHTLYLACEILPEGYIHSHFPLTLYFPGLSLINSN